MKNDTEAVKQEPERALYGMVLVHFADSVVTKY